MFIDSLLIFSTAGGQTITGTADSSNVIDLLNARDMGVGDDPGLELLVQVQTAMVSAGGATLTISLNGSTDNSTYSVYARSRVLTVADMTTPGARLMQFSLPGPLASDALPRYLKLIYTTATSTFSAGALYAALVLDRQDANPPAYPAGIVIAN